MSEHETQILPQDIRQLAPQVGYIIGLDRYVTGANWKEYLFETLSNPNRRFQRYNIKEITPAQARNRKVAGTLTAKA
jgi:hypothetical protein